MSSCYFHKDHSGIDKLRRLTWQMLQAGPVPGAENSPGRPALSVVTVGYLGRWWLHANPTCDPNTYSSKRGAPAEILQYAMITA